MILKTCPGGDVEAKLLSLMTSATSFSIQGEDTHYQFLHMTIQQFLAARWVASQSVYEQERFLVENWVNVKIKLMLVFFAGMTRLQGYLLVSFLEIFITLILYTWFSKKIILMIWPYSSLIVIDYILVKRQMVQLQIRLLR